MPKRMTSLSLTLQRAERHHDAGGQVGQADLEGAVPEHPACRARSGRTRRTSRRPTARPGPGRSRRCAARTGAAAPAGCDARLADHERRDADAASASMARVRVDVQPASLPPTTPYTASIREPVTSAAPSTSTRWRPSGPRRPGSGGRTSEPDGDADRHVDQEDPLPGQQAGQHAAGSTPTAPPPDITNPKTPIAFARSAGSVKRPMIRASATAETAAPPRPWTRGRRPAARRSAPAAQATRGDCERRDATEQDQAVAEQVPEPSREQQEAAEGQHVGVDHPGQRGLARSRARPGWSAAPRSRCWCRARS